jgi:hypothetical protein
MISNTGFEGHRPWRPTDDAELVATWDFYDMPLSGAFQTGEGRMWAFLCEEGELSGWNLWTYVPVEPLEVKLIDAAEDPDEVIEELRRMRPYVLAVANDYQGLVHAVEINPREEPFPTVIAAAQASFPSELMVELKHLIEPRS